MRQRHTTPCSGAHKAGLAVARLENTRPSCAVSVNGSDERSSVFGVSAERCGRDLKPANAINHGPFAMRHIGSREAGVGKVRSPAGEIHAAIQRSEHRQQTIFLLRGGEHLAQPDDNARRRREQPKNVETDLKYLPRPRRWPETSTTKPGKLRSF